MPVHGVQTSMPGNPAGGSGMIRRVSMRTTTGDRAIGEGMHYYRPRSLEEALTRLVEGVPLAGGTSLTPRRRDLRSVVDLQDIGLDAYRVEKGSVRAGAMLRLQAIVDAPDSQAPAALRTACRLEAAANVRRMATLGGSLFGTGGRSPLVCALLALGAEVRIAPGDEGMALDALLEERSSWSPGRLVTEVRWSAKCDLGFASVGRSPADRPIVCAALGRDGAGWRLAVGGWGDRPVLAAGGPAAPAEGDVRAAVKAARTACAGADDEWASGEYRSAVAAVLTQRLMREGMGG
jgi:CO/xanthine dehydrogenase FAD-binding subunit